MDIQYNENDMWNNRPFVQSNKHPIIQAAIDSILLERFINVNNVTVYEYTDKHNNNLKKLIIQGKYNRFSVIAPNINNTPYIHRVDVNNIVYNVERIKHVEKTKEK